MLPYIYIYFVIQLLKVEASEVEYLRLYESFRRLAYHTLNMELFGFPGVNAQWCLGFRVWFTVLGFRVQGLGITPQAHQRRSFTRAVVLPGQCSGLKVDPKGSKCLIIIWLPETHNYYNY